jgi:hypothetical protein
VNCFVSPTFTESLAGVTTTCAAIPVSMRNLMGSVRSSRRAMYCPVSTLRTSLAAPTTSTSA